MQQESTYLFAYIQYALTILDAFHEFLILGRIPFKMNRISRRLIKHFPVRREADSRLIENTMSGSEVTNLRCDWGIKEISTYSDLSFYFPILRLDPKRRNRGLFVLSVGGERAWEGNRIKVPNDGLWRHNRDTGDTWRDLSCATRQSASRPQGSMPNGKRAREIVSAINNAMLS